MSCRQGDLSGFYPYTSTMNLMLTRFDKRVIRKPNIARKLTICSLRLCQINTVGNVYIYMFRSSGGWCGRNKDAPLLCVWGGCQRGQQDGVSRPAYVQYIYYDIHLLLIYYM